MGKMDSMILKSKFRGSILGALMGDCLGSAYEGDEIFTAGVKLVLQRSLDKLEGPYFKAPVIQFTDDSAMTYAVGESLIERNEFDQMDMARKFVKSYFKEPNRGYGAGVTTVFNKLRNNKFDDVLGPAREQFNGQGSLGNGAAMRISPVALFCHRDYETMVETARKQSQITHTHKTGVDGAILQAIAIQQSLLLDPKEKLDTRKFADDLIEKMDKIEIDEEGLGLVDPSPYKTQLKLVKDLIRQNGDGPHEEKVVQLLGNDVGALHSVPTAIYCFLRAQNPIKDIQTENPLRRTIQYASTADFDHNDIRSVSKSVLRDDARRGRYRPNDEERSSRLTLDRYYPLSVFLKQNRQKPLSLQTSGDSVISLSPGLSSSCTIVCEKRSDYTCTSVKSFADRGMQWKSTDSEQNSPASYATYSVGKETKDSAIMSEYDEHDSFARTIAAHLRSMDVETALKAKSQIDKVITDHRLHKPETISLGGDTDTIGSMAGAIAGAFYGEDMISKEVLKHCEKSDEFRNLADKLFELVSV